MIKVGVTGGIGSGKSEVCKEWQQLGAYVLNADDLAKNIMSKDAQTKKELIKVFGERAFRKDGSLNRSYLAEEAFGNDRVDELNAIVHPKLPAAIKEEMNSAEQNGYDVFVIEAALLLNGLNPQSLDYIIIVLADQDVRIDRVQKRDDASRQTVVDRMNKQQDFGKLTHLADFVIENNGTLEELRQKAVKVFHQILQN